MMTKNEKAPSAAKCFALLLRTPITDWREFAHEAIWGDKSERVQMRLALHEAICTKAADVMVKRDKANIDALRNFLADLTKETTTHPPASQDIDLEQMIAFWLGMELVLHRVRKIKTSDTGMDALLVSGSSASLVFRIVASCTELSINEGDLRSRLPEWAQSQMDAALNQLLEDGMLSSHLSDGSARGIEVVYSLGWHGNNLVERYKYVFAPGGEFVSVEELGAQPGGGQKQ